ncbi:hypothetical protein DFJ77DRAFT_448808 [Powellomyces hirtus]|nr:hypothetical protein DFJ77DRAFT_448808 [Powellomyces hirtus]
MSFFVQSRPRRPGSFPALEKHHPPSVPPLDRRFFHRHIIPALSLSRVSKSSMVGNPLQAFFSRLRRRDSTSVGSAALSKRSQPPPPPPPPSPATLERPNSVVIHDDESVLFLTDPTRHANGVQKPPGKPPMYLHSTTSAPCLRLSASIDADRSYLMILKAEPKQSRIRKLLGRPARTSISHPEHTPPPPMPVKRKSIPSVPSIMFKQANRPSVSSRDPSSNLHTPSLTAIDEETPLPPSVVYPAQSSPVLLETSKPSPSHSSTKALSRMSSNASSREQLPRMSSDASSRQQRSRISSDASSTKQLSSMSARLDAQLNTLGSVFSKIRAGQMSKKRALSSRENLVPPSPTERGNATPHLPVSPVYTSLPRFTRHVSASVPHLPLDKPEAIPQTPVSQAGPYRVDSGFAKSELDLLYLDLRCMSLDQLADKYATIEKK